MVLSAQSALNPQCAGTFWLFFDRPPAIALGSKPPLVTRMAQIGLGTRLLNTVADRNKTESQNSKQNHKTQNRITKPKQKYKTQNRNRKLKTETKPKTEIQHR